MSKFKNYLCAHTLMLRAWNNGHESYVDKLIVDLDSLWLQMTEQERSAANEVLSTFNLTFKSRIQ
jgi:hypothetical protein